MNSSLQFLGAAGTVTGSKYLLKHADKTYLIDCGLFQGLHKLKERNWEPSPIDVNGLEAVILTHAHIDHTGYLPRLVQGGYHGPVYASEATCALLELLLPDSGYLQEEQASYANKKGYSRHKPALPLYTYQQALRSLQSLRPVKLDESLAVDEHLTVTMRAAGHILGSAILECELEDLKLVFSGDLGRYDQEVMCSPTAVHQADVLLVESTYGNRAHSREPLEAQLAQVAGDTLERGGVLLIPSFAVGRTQQLLYLLRKLQDQKRIPDLPIYVDSPMASDATAIYCRFGAELNLKVDLLMDEEACPLRCRETHFTRTVQQSKWLNEAPGPMIIISASGMCTGGRIVHHLKHRLPDPKNTVLFVGYQAQGTRGRLLSEGAQQIKIHGMPVPVRAKIASIAGLSAHGDYHELLRWLSGFERAPRQSFIVHGEPQAAEAFQERIHEQLGWKAHRPSYLETVTLGE
ncbi:MAG TPA: MBL fold metallo-hydrolase [Candidatus Fraserbacteria bacterium]|nr:MBL fold metallo-hydrolase [Candidatus Fraserbacteria bacterium]